ncbi:MAG: hypothetical protein V2B18_00095 [Pseudomonadota bacterium]
MKNVTITLDEETARWARVRAAELNTSVSRFVGELLRERMTAEETYRAAMTKYFSQSASLIRSPETKYPSRRDLHER